MTDIRRPGTVIPFPLRGRMSPQSVVPRGVPRYLAKSSAPARIDASVKLSKLLQGLSAVGLLFRHDARTGEFVILPDPEVRT